MMGLHPRTQHSQPAVIVARDQAQGFQLDPNRRALRWGVTQSGLNAEQDTLKGVATHLTQWQQKAVYADDAITAFEFLVDLNQTKSADVTGVDKGTISKMKNLIMRCPHFDAPLWFFWHSPRKARGAVALAEAFLRDPDASDMDVARRAAPHAWDGVADAAKARRQVDNLRKGVPEVRKLLGAKGRPLLRQYATWFPDLDEEELQKDFDVKRPYVLLPLMYLCWKKEI